MNGLWSINGEKVVEKAGQGRWKEAAQYGNMINVLPCWVSFDGLEEEWKEWSEKYLSSWLIPSLGKRRAADPI